MTTALFLSYSRREAPFVDALEAKLEKNGYPVWLDYKSLVPAMPWADQIENGIVAADTFLLVVSKAALASKYVALEWQRAIELNKRIVLVLFESTSLPPELAGCEWVDFRSAFENSLVKLTNLLENPAKPVRPAPQTGFNAPPVVWLSLLVSLIVVLISLPSIWTLYIPYHLVPLPYRILKRNFNFFHVQSALAILPLTVPLASFFLFDYTLEDEPIRDNLLGCALILSLFLPVILIFLLRSAGMQRWGKPVASRPNFANLYIPHIEHPRPVSFSLEAAPEDGKYAAAIRKTLEQYGHHYDPEAKNAEAVFVLISAYKNSSCLNPEERLVYPIIIQPNQAIDDKLQMIQWIDFRNGLKNLAALAQLLPEPTRLLEALGVVPAGEQIVLPRIIYALVNFLIILTLFTFSSYAVFLIRFSAELISSNLAGAIFCVFLPVALFLGIVVLTIRSLINRTGKLASPYILGLTMLLLSIFVFIQLVTSMMLVSPFLAGDTGRTTGMIISFTVTPLVYFIGLIIIIPLALYYWRDLWRWFPVKH